MLRGLATVLMGALAFFLLFGLLSLAAGIVLVPLLHHGGG